MRWRRSDYDVTNTINVTIPGEVCAEVCRLFRDLYPGESAWRIEKAFDDLTALFQGRLPGYQACETPYHDLQHTLDVALTMARLLHSHEQHEESCILGPERIQAGILVAMFHDAGYMRRHEDEHRHGAAYTLSHVSRSALFLHDYLPTLKMAELAPMAGRLVHYTGYEMHIDDIPVRSSQEQRLGHLVGTADLLAQIADRCYLEKCRDRLYYEFAIAGIAGAGIDGARFQSQQEMLAKTPAFISHAIRDRLNEALGSVHRYSEAFFLPEQNLYWQAIQKNIDYISAAVERNEMPLLRRNPPWTLTIAPHELKPDFPPRS